MKKLISFALAIAMLVVLTACHGGSGKDVSGATAEPTEAAETANPTEAATDEPTEEPTAEPTATPGPTEEPDPIIMELPALPCVVQDGPRTVSIDYGETIETWGTTYYVTVNGDLYAMGSNKYYQLGDVTQKDSAEQVLIMEGVVSINAVNGAVLALCGDGSLYAWGVTKNRFGAGMDDYGFKTPKKILENVAEYDHYYALDKEGGFYSICAGGDIGGVHAEKLMEGVRSYQSPGAYHAYVVTEENELYLLDCTGTQVFVDKLPEAADWEKKLIAENVKEICGECFGIAFIDDDTLYKVVYDYETGDYLAAEPVLEGVAKWYSAYGSVFVICKDNTLWGIGNLVGGYEEDESVAPRMLLEDVMYFDAAYYMDEDLGYEYNFAIKTDNTLWAWGPNWYGELGVSRDTSTAQPVCVAEDVARVYSDGFSTYIIKTDGSLWASGYNGFKGSPWEEYGWGLGISDDDARLGTGDNVTIYEFVKIMDDVVTVGQFNGWVFTNYDDGTDSTSCYARAFAVKTDGTLWGWGYNIDGAVVAGGERYLLSPVQIMTVEITNDR